MLLVCIGVSGCVLKAGGDSDTEADAAAPTVDADTADTTDATPGSDATNAVTVEFGDTSTSDVTGVTTDAEIWSEFPDNNHGNVDHFSLDGDGIEIGLLQFDISSLPSTATISSATLAISTLDSSAAGVVVIHRLQEQWDEGSLDNQLGAVSWNDRRPGIPWTTEGAGDGTYDPVELASFTLDGSSPTRYQVSLPVAAVQAWLADPSTNAGLRLSQVDPDHTHITSSEATLVDHRPALIVEYLP